MTAQVPVALTIAGSDSSAGAGIQADLKTFSARGVYGLTAVTCIVAETPGNVLRIEPVEPAMVHEQVDLLLRNFPVGAIKTGLLCNTAIVEIVARRLRAVKHRSLVVDPVMIATSGNVLLQPEAVVAYERQLFPLATVITPNLDEAARLLGETISGVEEMKRAARVLAKKYRAAVLVKGGHLHEKRAVDVLSDGTHAREFSAAFVPNVKTHGTGCTYSAAIAAELARGMHLARAIANAKRFVTAAIRSHLVWQSARGRMVVLNLFSTK